MQNKDDEITMKILDIDMDYFLDYPVNYRSHSLDERVDDIECEKSVWSEERVRTFLEKNLGLSKDKKIKGRIVKGHNESLFFWKELIDKKQIVPPFSVVHIDSHADLGCGSIGGLLYVLDELIYWPVDIRIRYCYDEFEVDGKFYGIDIGDYLLFAIAYRWISDLTYCGNPHHDSGDVPSQILIKKLPNYKFKKTISTSIKIVPRNISDRNLVDEPEILFTIIPNEEDVKYTGNFDYAVMAQSPNYTPGNADYIMDVFKEYIDEI